MTDPLLASGPFENGHINVLGHRIPHYYGDPTRRLFVAAGVVSLLAIPVAGNLLPYGLYFQIASSLFLVLLAGLTNPKSTAVMAFDVLISGVGVLLLESAAIVFYDTDSVFLFGAREITALLLLFGFYFSVKTLRSMLGGQIGKDESRLT